MGADGHGFDTSKRGRCTDLLYVGGRKGESAMTVQRSHPDNDRPERNEKESLVANKKRLFQTPENKTCEISPSNPCMRHIKRKEKKGKEKKRKREREIA